MSSSPTVVLPTRKEYRVLCIICIIGLLVIMSDFFRKPVTSAVMILTICFCLFTFYLGFRRISISPSEIQVSLFRIPVRRIKKSNLACIEMVKLQNELCVLFELGKCERYDISGFISLTDYCALNCFRVIDYTIPKGQEEYVSFILNSMYDVHIADMSDKI